MMNKIDSIPVNLNVNTTGDIGYIGRVENESGNLKVLTDLHRDKTVMFNYATVAGGKSDNAVNILPAGNVTRIHQGNDIGIVAGIIQDEKKYTVWIPESPKVYTIDMEGRIFDRDESIVDYRVENDKDLSIKIYNSQNLNHIYFSYIVFLDEKDEIFKDITELSAIEKSLYIKSRWFEVRYPRQLWKYLIHGSVYDPRSHKDILKRHKCQQCAYALWTYFQFLHLQTKKKLYSILQDEIAYTVYQDQGNDGSWRHGYWSDTMEIHSRFSLDGIHLLISQHRKDGKREWLAAAERGMNYIIDSMSEKLENGDIWILHDTIEHTKNHKVRSTLLGKSQGNSLCLNTHVQALTVLNRLKVVSSESERYNLIYESGLRLAKKVLDLESGNTLSGWMMIWINHRRNRRRRGNKIIKLFRIWEKTFYEWLYWKIRGIYPRLVQQNGFIERDLSLNVVSEQYHIINVKDLLTLYSQDPQQWLVPYIQNGVDYIIQYLNSLEDYSIFSTNGIFIEIIDILYMYDKHVKSIDKEYFKEIENKINNQIDGKSLDLYSSEFVLGRSL